MGGRRCRAFRWAVGAAAPVNGRSALPGLSVGGRRCRARQWAVGAAGPFGGRSALPRPAGRCCRAFSGRSALTIMHRAAGVETVDLARFSLLVYIFYILLFQRRRTSNANGCIRRKPSTENVDHPALLRCVEFFHTIV
jgi:hypothetical protein